MPIPVTFAKAAVREYLKHDLGPLRGPAVWGGYSVHRLMRALGRPAEGLTLLMQLHSTGLATSLDRRIAEQIRDATGLERRGIATGLWSAYERSIERAVATFRGSGSTLTNLLRRRMLVIKSPRGHERGVLVADYSYVFPLLAGLFDLGAIAERYTIVLEPSWSGACAPEILHFTRFDFPVFVETIEPRDHALLETLASNVQAIPLAANCWVDHRTISPRSREERDIDVIAVAAWSTGKRHWRLFRSLANLKRRGRRLNAVLVGYRDDLSMAQVAAQARHFGVLDQVQFFERIPQPEVSSLLARSKVHVLWSRRECANRAIVEAMFADVPVIVREGLTYGFPYPYINEHTGRFVAEDALDDAILSAIENAGTYSPRAWALEHMTCLHATARLEAALASAACGAGQQWSEGIVPRAGALDRQHYWNDSDCHRFDGDYRFLESMYRP